PVARGLLLGFDDLDYLAVKFIDERAKLWIAHGCLPGFFFSPRLRDFRLAGNRSPQRQPMAENLFASVFDSDTFVARLYFAFALTVPGFISDAKVVGVYRDAALVESFTIIIFRLASRARLILSIGSLADEPLSRVAPIVDSVVLSSGEGVCLAASGFSAGL